MLASRLGYRITSKFVHTFFGRVFDNPTAVFAEEILKPEIQDRAVFADGVNNIVEAQQRVAEAYFADGDHRGRLPAAQGAAPHHGARTVRGKRREPSRRFARYSPGSRCSRATGIASASSIKQQRDVALWERHVRSLTEFLARAGHRDEAERLGIAGRLEHARAELERVSAPEYMTALVGTIGADPVHRPLRGRPDREVRSVAGTRGHSRPAGAGR